jgi:hypothetical protein
MTYQSDTTTTAGKGRTPVGAVPGFAYLDWAAIIAGAVVATATSLLMLTFGSALGLSMVSAEPGEGASLRWVSIAGGIWFIWVVLSSIGAGAYLAGRLRHPIGDAVSDEVELRDGTQGLVVWGLAVVLGTMMAANGVTGITTAAAQSTAAVAGGISDVVEEPLGAITGNLVRDPTGAAVASDALRDETSSILMRGLTDGEISEEDRTYLVSRISAETGQPPVEVQARLDEATAAAQSMWDEAQERIEQARRAAVIAAFMVAATLLAGAATGYFAAVAGGKHRDDNIPFRSLRR